MESYQSPRAVWTSYTSLRAGDGKSSNSSSQQSLLTTSTVTTASTEVDARDDVSDSSSVALLDITSHITSFHPPSLSEVRSASRVEVVDTDTDGLGCRPSPDGCSMSSESCGSKDCLCPPDMAG